MGKDSGARRRDIEVRHQCEIDGIRLRNMKTESKCRCLIIPHARNIVLRNKMVAL